ncbi:MAG: GNAT family N-acetyltransferase [Bacteroidales bacterium]|nr:GNAT family N-acetyltransferase [Bacteroidales bacterium]MCM1147593.1 GNAT family N-acetyltransferase [Bacteroidales bacterium]MCM1206383.1 GNAT family N-acetyltransferase [Bacillota bacterium]MCM1509117.1 GNAT family N-acetyltransferase [Clostridium sp.]
MTEKRITALNADCHLRQLYEASFPAEEQIPWNELLWLVDAMSLDFTAYYHTGQLAGMTVVYPRKSFNWFWYFAVREELRGRGTGQKILSALMNKYAGSANILDIESPEQVCANSVMRKRRYDFYLRNGFRDTGVGRSFDGIDYVILMKGTGTFVSHDYDTILSELQTFRSSMPCAEV